jgi:hypothetical protein
MDVDISEDHAETQEETYILHQQTLEILVDTVDTVDTIDIIVIQ